MTITYRYPGVKPFEAADAALFFGRDHDRKELLDLVNREKLVVLFGKSGYGKSSLIKAGLIPDLNARPNIVLDPKSGEEHSIPNKVVYIRLNHFSGIGRAVMPCDTVLERFHEQVDSSDTDDELSAFLEKCLRKNTIWSAFRCSKSAASQRTFLVFDQFEEFFSYPLEAQVQFRQELSELLYTRIPQTVRDEMGKLDLDGKRRLHQSLEVRTVFAIRSDRIHLLNSMRDELSAILQMRYEVKALNEQQAKAAILKPAQMTGKGFILKKPFDYEPAALQKILSELNKTPEDEGFFEKQNQIEAFQLQMVCQTIEQNLVKRTNAAKGVQPLLVRVGDLPDFEQIYEQYYVDKIEGLPDEQSRQIAHVLLEEEMILGESQSDARRISVDNDMLKESMMVNHQLQVKDNLLDYLEDNFLIRRETIGGRTHYEISHDVLLLPLMKAREIVRRRKAEDDARKKRDEIEKREKEKEMVEQARIEKERRKEAESLKLKAEQALKAVEVEKQKALRNFRFAIGLTILSFIVSLLAGYLYYQSQLDKIKLEKVLTDLKNERAALDRLELANLKKRGNDLYNNGFYISAIEMYQRANTLTLKYPEFKDMYAEHLELEQKINESLQRSPK